jgi:acyl-CoA dehydrogenase
MDFEYSPRTAALLHQLQEFMERYIIPAMPRYATELTAGSRHPQVVEELKEVARAEGLWNLFLPGLKDDEPGQRLSNLEYAPLAEIMGRVAWASEVFNCSAPDTGNMEILHLFATPAQRERWLDPLLAGTIRSCFAMTEPDAASSDATNIQTSIRRAGDEYVINGRKWFISGAAHPHCKVAIVMGVTDPDGPAHRRQSMVLVPLATPGVTIVRDLPVMQHFSAEGHCELTFVDVHVPAGNLIHEEGAGFAIAQARLGPGRVHHCMRSIGQCELALELMCARAAERRTFCARPLSPSARHRGRVDRAVPHRDRAGASARAQGGMAHGSRRAESGSARNRHDQGAGAARADDGLRSRHADLRGHGPECRHATGDALDLGQGVAPGGWSRRGSPALGGEAGNAARR